MTDNLPPALDVACGGRSFYFDKDDERVLKCDAHPRHLTLCDGRTLDVSPDTEISSRLGVGYSVFSDAVAQYAQAKATESLIFSVMFFVVAFLAIAIFFFAVFLNRSMDTADKAFLGFLLVIILLFVMLPGICALAGYINWSNAPQGMFLREIIESIK